MKTKFEGTVTNLVDVYFCNRGVHVNFISFGNAVPRTPLKFDGTYRVVINLYQFQFRCKSR